MDTPRRERVRATAVRPTTLIIMAIGETLGGHGSHITVAAAIAGQGIVTLLRGPDPVFALYAALIAGSV